MFEAAPSPVSVDATLGREAHTSSACSDSLDTSYPTLKLPPRPQSARSSPSGRRPAWPRGCSTLAGSTGLTSRLLASPRYAASSSTETPVKRSVRRPHSAGSAAAAAMAAREGAGATEAALSRLGAEGTSSLMKVMLQVYEHRTSPDVWLRILEPLRQLVPCEDVKVTVRSIGPPPQEEPLLGPFNPAVRERMPALKYVEHWPAHRIEGYAALHQQICSIPSSEAARQHWDKYEASCTYCREHGSCTPTSGLRCLVAVPLFDGEGNALAVLKLFNRRLAGGQTALEFSKADVAVLSAFSALFACVLPHPFLGLPGAGLCRRPEARFCPSDAGLSVTVAWQLPIELRGPLNHEVLFGPVEHEDDFLQTPNTEKWTVMPCGLLEPLSEAVSLSDEEELCELNFEFQVPLPVNPQRRYGFCIRARNLHAALPWSAPSAAVPTFVACPFPEGSEVVRLIPVGDAAVRLEWASFTCALGLSEIEYRVLARAVASEMGRSPAPSPRRRQAPSPGHRGTAESSGQVVATLVSRGSHGTETVTVANLQSNQVYVFSIEARYPFVGPRSFTPGLTSDPFTFPTVDLSLPAPQPLVASAFSGPVPTVQAGFNSTSGGLPPPLLIKWPYPRDLSAQLVLQYRTAAGDCLEEEEEGLVPARLQVSQWLPVRPGDCLVANLSVESHGSSDLRLLRDSELMTSLAVQLRVVAGRGNACSSPSSWFHPAPPAPPQEADASLSCSDHDGLALHISWQDFSLPPTQLGDLGPLGHAVHHDFANGYGPHPTRMQVRIRQVACRGEAMEPWEELPPQLMPPQAVDAFGRLRSTAVLTEQRWFLQHGLCWELELRVGNMLMWSSWVAAGEVEVAVPPPVPCDSTGLRCEELRAGEVELVWPVLLPADGFEGLGSMEYRVLCAGQSEDSLDTKALKWRTLEVITVNSSNAGLLSTRVHGLQQDRQCSFAVECRYLGLPYTLSTGAVARLQAQSALDLKPPQLVVHADSLTVERSFAPSLVATPLEVGGAAAAPTAWHGVRLRLRWRFGAEKAGAPLPPRICYQLRCISDASSSCGAQAQVALPQALLVEHSRAVAGDDGTTGLGTFTLERCRDRALAEVELSAGQVQPLLRAAGVSPLAPVRFSVRLGDASGGSWGDWTVKTTGLIELGLVPPLPVVDDELVVQEEVEEQAESTGLHSVEAVHLSWLPFEAFEGTPNALHSRLVIDYEVVVWAVDYPESSLQSLEMVRTALEGGHTESVGACAVFRRWARPKLDESTGRCLITIPGSSLLPRRYHFFQVSARYLFPDPDLGGESVGLAAVPEVATDLLLLLISSQPLRPAAARPPVPVLEPFSPPYDELPGPCAVLFAPVAASVLGTDTLQIEVRGGKQVGAGFSAVGDWVTCSEEQLELLSAERLLYLVRGLSGSVCQFRLSLGNASSLPSSWTDTSVWRPDVLSAQEFATQLNAAVGSVEDASVALLGDSCLTGLGVALSVTLEGSLSALLMWPERPPHGSAVPLTRVQARYRSAGGTWTVLSPAELPPASASGTVSRHIHSLEAGLEYEFSIRLCNALSRWSEWSAATSPLRLALPLPRAREDVNEGLSTAAERPGTVRLSWPPFTIPRRPDWERQPPLLLDTHNLLLGEGAAVQGEYEVVVRATSSTCGAGLRSQTPVLSVLRCSGSVILEELLEGPLSQSRQRSLEVDVPLQPETPCCFEVRARLPRSGSGAAADSAGWGPPAFSAAMAPRLSATAVTSLQADLLVRPHRSGTLGQPAWRAFEALLQLEVGLRGFRGHDNTQLPVEKAVALARYQLRSAKVDETRGGQADQWEEWSLSEATSSLGSRLRVEIPLIGVDHVRAGSSYRFSIRCQDTFGHFTEWSSASEPIFFGAPALGVEQASRLTVTPAGSSGALLEWPPFRPVWPSGNVTIPPGLTAALRRIAYRLRVSRRATGAGESSWVNLPAVELDGDRCGREATLSHEIQELEPHCEYQFGLSARWLDMPMELGNESWSAEITSSVLSSRLPELKTPQAPSAELSASEGKGLGVRLRLGSRAALQGATGCLPAGARRQLRMAQFVEGQDLDWQQLPTELEEGEQAVSSSSSSEAQPELFGLSTGNRVVFGLRIGDVRQWSSWSATSEPLLLALQAPMPVPGDALEVEVSPRSDEGSSLRQAVLSWRPFRRAPGLQTVEYKVLALEWPQAAVQRKAASSSEEGGALERLWQFAQVGGLARAVVPRTCRTVGFVTSTEGSEVLRWRVDWLRPGWYCRFFVCARYSALPLGALAPLPTLPPLGQGQVLAWPDEQCDPLRDDNNPVPWEASMSRIGLWSAIVSCPQD